MTTKFKILSAISFVALAIVLTFVGVWALTDLDFTVGGNIEYTAPVPEAKDVSEYPTLQFYVTDSTNKEVLVQQNQRNKPIGELVIPSKVISNGVEYTVTSLAVAEGQTLLSTTRPEKQIQLPQMRAMIEEPIEPITGSFEGCNNLTKVIIPNSVTSIGNNAFYYCTGLTSAELGSGVTSIGNNAFYYCTGLTSVELGSGVTSIGVAAFKDCTSLTSITIPDKVTSIGNNAFQNCTKLTSITIPDKVTSIGEDAFYDCTGLTSVTIGSGVTSIGKYAFFDCTSLVKVEVKATTVPTGRYGMFSGCPLATGILVPSASVCAYQSAANWSDYADCIKAGDF